jgi:hypothetical protein
MAREGSETSEGGEVGEAGEKKEGKEGKESNAWGGVAAEGTWAFRGGVQEVIVKDGDGFVLHASLPWFERLTQVAEIAGSIKEEDDEEEEKDEEEEEEEDEGVTTEKTATTERQVGQSRPVEQKEGAGDGNQDSTPSPPPSTVAKKGGKGGTGGEPDTSVSPPLAASAHASKALKGFEQFLVESCLADIAYRIPTHLVRGGGGGGWAHGGGEGGTERRDVREDHEGVLTSDSALSAEMQEAALDRFAYDLSIPGTSIGVSHVVCWILFSICLCLHTTNITI